MKFKKSCLIGPLPPVQRQLKASKIRVNNALFYKGLPLTSHPCNGDDLRYPNKIASYSKALPHNELGEVNLYAYYKYLTI